MPRIAFHFGAPHKWHYASRLLRKALARGSKVVVSVDTRDMTKMDAALWSLDPAEFVPHCQMGAPNSVLQRSPIVLMDSRAAAPWVGGVLVNLGEQVPLQLDDFERVIEVVSTDDAERSQARTRWRHYAQLGYPIDRHDIQAMEGR